ncbi:MAG TPA: glycoside hydrolase family 95 protein [Plantibacter sp.]|uniref:glycoside hydrolase family 95 protein n=1 Tax=unclassified Plantibacter TaxID=2624265 RepID=UPI002CC99058|nr:glycoside hydrolase family 95 protein [Plantibacter sp.]
MRERVRRIVLDAPADGFVERFLLGNGSLGAAVDGVPGEEGIDLNLDTLWSGGPDQRDAARAIGDVDALRAAIADGDFAAAEQLAGGVRGSRFSESYQPLGRISVRSPARGTVEEYERSLDLTHAIAETRYAVDGAPVRLSVFVSAPDDVLVIEVEGVLVDAIELDFRSPHRAVIERRTDGDIRWSTASGRAPSTVAPSYLPVQGGVEYADDRPDGDGLVDAGMGWAVSIATQSTATGSRIIVAAASGFRGWRHRPSADLPRLQEDADARVRRAVRSETAALRDRHVAGHRSLFDRALLDLSPSGSEWADRCERSFDLGRYLLIASSRLGSQAANLQGIWNDQVRPPWSSNYTTNINVQMNYWHAESTGLGELATPLLELLTDLVEAGSSTASTAYGFNGSVTHHNTDIWRFTEAVPLSAHWSNWPSALPWLAAHLHRHLADHAADPAADPRSTTTLEPIVRFVLDLLVDDGSGALVSSPSTSPENQFHSVEGVVAVSAGSTMDQELVRECLSAYLVLAERRATVADLPLVHAVRSALRRLALPVIGADGALLEWSEEREPVEVGHRHLSHLYGLYPGTRITETATPDAFHAARLALEKRLRHGGGATGWSRAWVLCLAARLRDPELADASLRGLLDMLASVSLLDLHPVETPDEYVFQIDGNFGTTAGIVELLVQGHDGAISLLPTLPPGWPAGRAHGLRVRGGHTVAMEWSAHRITSASLVLVDSDVPLEVPDDGRTVTVVGPTGPVDIRPGSRAPTGRRRVVWSGAGTYEIRFT